MATALLNLTFTNATDAEFRAWGSAISNTLTAFGITKTADTGQVDFATTIRPTVVSDMSRYEIRQLTDSLQSSLPVFLKVIYGSAANSSTQPYFYIQVGTGTNGNGVLTNAFTPVAVNGNSLLTVTAAQTTTTPCYLSGSSSRLGLVLFAGTSSSTFFFLERSKNTLKQDTSLAAQLFKNSASGGKNNYFIKSTGTVVEEVSGIFTPAIGNNATVGNKSANYPNFFFDNGFIQEPGITHSAHYLNDNSAIAVPYTIKINGVDRTYISFGSAGAMQVSRGNVSGIILTMLYE